MKFKNLSKITICRNSNYLTGPISMLSTLNLHLSCRRFLKLLINGFMASNKLGRTSPKRSIKHSCQSRTLMKSTSQRWRKFLRRYSNNATCSILNSRFRNTKTLIRPRSCLNSVVLSTCTPFVCF